MMTETPQCEIIEEEKAQVSMEIPLQKMFDEMLVFISKTDFE